jgi:hypothetical protein
LTAPGALTPAVVGSAVSVTYTPIRGNPVTDTAKTDASGAYSDTFTPTTPGGWTAQAHSAGDSTRQPATSASCTFSVG